MGAAHGSLKSQREPAQQRPLRLEAPSRSAPSKRGYKVSVRESGTRPYGDCTEPHAGRVWTWAQGYGAGFGQQGDARQVSEWHVGRGGLEDHSWERESRGQERELPSLARNLGSPDRYRAASSCRSIQAGALGGRFHSRAAEGTKGGGVSFRISTAPNST